MKLIVTALFIVSSSAFAGPFSGLRTFVNDGSGDIDACRYDDAAINPARSSDDTTASEGDAEQKSDENSADATCACGADMEQQSAECSCGCCAR